jgi:hypothetical protein
MKDRKDKYSYSKTEDKTSRGLSGRRPLVINATDITTPAKPTSPSSFLVTETKHMARSQRISEQDGHRQLGVRVIARDHNLDEQKQSPEGELQNSIQQHPLLDSQRYAGVNPELNPEPPLNSAARTAYDNEQREQEKEKQFRLGNMPKMGTAPKPHRG